MAEELQQADTAANQAEANAENRPAGGSRTYTEAEVDARIKSRIDKQNARHAEELEGIRAKLAELEERSAKAEAERDALTKAAEIEKLKQDAAAENGIPAHLILSLIHI